MRSVPAVGVVALLVPVAWLWGGYDPGALLILELGAPLLMLTLLIVGGLDRRGSGGDVRARFTAWKRLPFWVRHPELASVVRVLTFGRFPDRRSSPDVEILLPGSGGKSGVELDLAREAFLLGQPVKRTGLLAPLSLLTLWIAMSLLPLAPGLLGALSPEAARLRTETARLLGFDSLASSAPWSLAPYPSLRALWLWLAVMALFYVAFRVARAPSGAVKLGLSLLLLGTASGVFGIAGFLSDLQGAQGRASEALRATGSFGNPNHYAAFQSMLLLSSLGWLAWLRERSHPRPSARTSARRPDSWNEKGLATIAGLALLVSALGLLLSLSRSGIAFAFAGVGTFAMLTLRQRHRERGRSATLRALVVFAISVVGIASWIGLEPLMGRFAGLHDQWNKEATRIQVWRDSAPAIGDFWLTGSGLSSFRYMGAQYRSFGGSIFYSWAHNDYLQLGIELGIPGLVLLAWIGFAVVRAARRARSDLAPDGALLALHAGAASAIVAVALHSLTDFSLHLPANLALAAILAGVVVGMEPGPEASKADRSGLRVTM